MFNIYSREAFFDPKKWVEAGDAIGGNPIKRMVAQYAPGGVAETGIWDETIPGVIGVLPYSVRHRDKRT